MPAIEKQVVKVVLVYPALSARTKSKDGPHGTYLAIPLCSVCKMCVSPICEWRMNINDGIVR
jgi:hypothetical protein